MMGDRWWKWVLEEWLRTGNWTQAEQTIYARQGG